LTPTPLPTAAPSPTPRPTPPPGAAAVDWNNDIGPMLHNTCSGCHGGGIATAGLDIGSYQDALKGGNSGPGVVPGEPESSYLVIVQQTGTHPGQLDAAELDTLINWVNAGAPESLEGAAANAGSVPTYQDDVAEVFDASCGTCHGSTALGGLNLTTYDTALAGGQDGPVIIPGVPESSKLIEVQSAGGHAGQLSDEDLELVRTWIEVGAPDTAADVPGGSASGGSTIEIGTTSLTYTNDIGPLFQAKCGTCHGETAIRGLNLFTYETAMAGGSDGPVIIPGDPNGSLLVKIQAAGGHPGQFTEDELDQVRDWIAGGAPE